MSDNNGSNHEIRLRPAWRAFALHYMAIAVFLLGPWLNPQAMLTPLTGQLVAAVLLLFVLVKRYGSDYMLGEKTLLIKNPGFQPVKIALRSVSQVQMRQGAIKRLLNYGNLIVYGSDSRPIMLYGLYRPEAVKQYIQNAATIS